MEKEYPDGWFEKAIKEARKSTTRISLNYLRAIMKRWKTDGLPQKIQEKKEYQEPVGHVEIINGIETFVVDKENK